MRFCNLKNKKFTCFVLLVIAIILFSYNRPTFGKYNNRGKNDDSIWTGLTAADYRSGSGTVDNPYIISTGEELSYFASQLENNNYSGNYFKIVNNILLNEGIFKYENNVLMYTVGGITYYVNNDKYYDNPNFVGEEVGTLNLLGSLNGFKGTLTGDAHTIYGYYGDDALFTNLEGNVTSLYLENGVVNASGSTALFANTITSSNISNIIADGYVITSTYVAAPNEEININLEEIGNKTIVGGLVAFANDSVISKCISKVNISGGYISGGLIGYSYDSSISNGYTTGELNSFSSNAIGIYVGTGAITRIYNSGTINGGLIGYIINATTTIDGVFNVTDNDLVLGVTDSTVEGSHNYYVYDNRGGLINSTQVTDANLKNKTFLTNYPEFVSKNDLKNNPQKLWIYTGSSYPLLYFDDIVNDISELHIGAHVWNSFSSNDLYTYNLTGNLVFMISDVDNIHVTNKYYYVVSGETPLSRSSIESIDWIPYSDTVTITEEGKYIIYVKTVDNNDNISYINSDVLILDNSEASIAITMGNNTYTNLMENDIYVDSAFNISVSAQDNLSGVSSIEYYLSNARVNDLMNVTWNTYNNPVSVNSIGEYILYVKVVDGCNIVTYASTPLITYDGYTVNNLKPVGFDSGNQITKNSSVMFDISYSNNKQLSMSHNLVTSESLPINTKITLLDKTNNKVYEYTVTNLGTIYPLTSFKEKGKGTDTYYTEDMVTNESFTVILDFANCNISDDYSNINVYLEGVNNDVVVRPTITKTGFTILSNSSLLLSHAITTTYNGSINYKSDSITDVIIHNGVTMGNAYDTSYSDKKLGLAIRIEDENNEVIDAEFLKNIIFKIGDDTYAPDTDNIIRINLNTNSTSDITLSIVTYDGSLKLEDGIYTIKIYGYVSEDGIYYNNSNLTDPITIPLVVSNNSHENLEYNFKVNSTGDVIVSKGDVVDYSFKIMQDGLKNPNIKVSMYKKKRLTAYNQEYTLIDMGDYSDTTLDEYIENIYYVSRSAYSYSKDKKYDVFNYRLNTTALDKTCYKFVFDVYSGNTKVDSISKYIIVR